MDNPESHRPLGCTEHQFMFLELHTKCEWHANALEASKVALDNMDTKKKSVRIFFSTCVSGGMYIVTVLWSCNAHHMPYRTEN